MDSKFIRVRDTIINIDEIVKVYKNDEIGLHQIKFVLKNNYIALIDFGAYKEDKIERDTTFENICYILNIRHDCNAEKQKYLDEVLDLGKDDPEFLVEMIEKKQETDKFEPKWIGTENDKCLHCRNR